MTDFLYYAILFPLVQIIEISFAVADRMFRHKAIAIFGVSAAVTICTMPLYYIAEKWQQVERDMQKKLKPKVDKIKAVFKGDERYMILSVYYRQNHYHPVYALRSSLGIIIQIPFFLAAYSYLSKLTYINGTSFLFIKDLGVPDRTFSINGFYINIFPILMTVINIISGSVYTIDKPFREKIQIYGMASVFLILLYNSPSGLVLYWTMNNILSLLKNILARSKHRMKLVYGFLCLFALSTDIYLFSLGLSPKRVFVAGFCSLIFFVPLFIKLFRRVQKYFRSKVNIEQSSLSNKSSFFLSSIILCVLTGLVIPGSLIASSVQEFSFLESYTTPLPFIYTVFIQALGIFFLWPLCVYLLFPEKIKRVLAFILSLICVIALVNTFIFPGDYGYLTVTFKFQGTDTLESKYGIIILNLLAIAALSALVVFLLLTKKKIIFVSFQIIALISLSSFALFNIYKINKDYGDYENLLKESGASAAENETTEPVYQLSKNGNNVMVIMLDSAISGYFPHILNEKPELRKAYSGFTYYPNCVGFGSHTRIGAPAIFGGYEYQPANIQKDRSYAMEKHNEALLMMPRIFSAEGYKVTVTDPTFANYSWKPDLGIFAPYPEISVYNTISNYTGAWMRSHPELELVSVPELLKELLIRFSFFKIAPSVFRVFIYDLANWLKAGGNLSDNQISLDTLDNYSNLDFLPRLTGFSDKNGNTYTAIVNDLIHYPAFFQYPDYIPATEITNKGNGPFSSENLYHANMAALLLLGKWLAFLQDNGVYDNTRIIIVSDHGRGVPSEYEGNMTLPDGNWLSRFHSLLLVKDFNASGEPVTDKTFMTQADVPRLAMKGLIENPQNPFSGNPIASEKEEGVYVSTSTHLQFTIGEDQWLRARDNIFIPSNWEKAKK